MSALRFGIEYSPSGRQLSQTLTASAVTSTASLQISRTFRRTLTASAVLESAALSKQSLKPFNVGILETGTLTLQKSRVYSAAVGESAVLASQVTKSPRATITVNATVVSGHLYYVYLNATVSSTASLGNRQSFVRTFTPGPITVAVSLSAQRMWLLGADPINVIATNIRLQFVSIFLVATPILETVVSVRQAKAGIIVASPVIETVQSLRYVRTTRFSVIVSETATLNKRGRYPQPAQVLQLYDTDTPYVLPTLKGATVSYVNGILGGGVAFDIYAALQQAAFGIKYRDLILAHDPVGFWMLSEKTGTTAADETGASPGVYMGGYALGQDGALNVDPTETAVKFDGSTSFVRIPDSSSLNFTNRYTLESWVYLYRLQTGAIVAHGWVDMDWALSVTAAGNLVLSVDSLHSAQSSTAIPLNRWTHVAGSFDGTNVRFYVNGTKEGTYPTVYDPASQYRLNNDVSIGAAQDTANSSSVGSVPIGAVLDEVAVYNYALSDAMIQAHYTTGNQNPIVAINSQFYVCDNGLKESLDKHPAVVRIS